MYLDPRFRAQQSFGPEHFEKHQNKFYRQLLYREKYATDEKTLPLRPRCGTRLIHMGHFVTVSLRSGSFGSYRASAFIKISLESQDWILYYLLCVTHSSVGSLRNNSERVVISVFGMLLVLCKKFFIVYLKLHLHPTELSVSRTDEF